MKQLSKTVLMRCCVAWAFAFGAMLGSTAQAQSLSVSGRIVDETNQPVMGAGIIEKGTDNGTVSDLDGQFTIVTRADAVLEFSSLGYDSKEVAVNGNSVINVVLTSSLEFLEDVVVVGYGVQKKKLITGSTIEYIADEQGAVKQAILQVMELGEPDASGRRSPVPVEGKTVTLDVDQVIVAVGVSPNPLVPKSIQGLELGRKNTIAVNDDMQSSRAEIFAGGDIVRGGATVILAMGDGRRAALNMDKHLRGEA